ncbi:MAG: glycosyltransferase family 2 protein [Deltaproteobacteria bacterium]|nr:glycosyltransferase family 2 protein [Deltaproteobacteria bacterium]
MDAAPLVSVIVLNFNGAAILPRCLDHLLAQTYAAREILVVDNASSDGSDAVLAAYAARGVRTVASPVNRGCAGGRNAGLAAARGAIIAFMDNDGYADPAWLAECVAALTARPGIGAIAPLVFFDRQGLVLNGAGGTLNRRGYGGDYCFQEPYEFAELPHAVLYPMGCGMVVRREVLEAMGGFDEALFNYYDDVEVGTWAWRLGLEVLCAPRAWVDHGFGSSNALNRNKIDLCERNRIRTILKYFPAHLLPAWALRELGSLLLPRSAWRWAVPWRAWGWNLANLASTWRLRQRYGPRRGYFDALIDPSWGTFPPPLPTNHLTQTDPAAATDQLPITRDDAASPLSYGWYPPEHDGPVSMRWTAAHAAAFVRAPAAAARLEIEWRAARPEVVTTLRLRRLDDLAVVWHRRALPGTAWSQARLDCDVPPGAYELQLCSQPANADAGGRPLGVGIARLALR